MQQPMEDQQLMGSMRAGRGRTAAAKRHPGNRIALEGEWDLARKTELQALLDGLTTDGPVTIDLRGLTYCDSSALELLARLVFRLQGTPITLLRPQPHIVRLLKLVNFDKLFNIVDEG